MTRCKAYWRMISDRFAKPLAWTAANPMKAVGLYLLAISAFFFVFPAVDLWASGLFYSDEGGFFARNEAFLRRFRHLGPHLVKIVAITSVVVLLAKLFLPARSPLMPLRAPVFLLTTLILGPGILVNMILKNNWGRPRPVMVDVFGGDMPYQPVWLPTDWCDTNCSFVSGEASAGMWLIVAVFIAPVAWRLALLAFLLPLGLLLSLNRIAFGGHFLSDTLISWGLTLLVILVVHRILYVQAPAWLRDTHLDEWFTRKGRTLQVMMNRGGTRAAARMRRFAGMFGKRH
ncbi:phosphatase PAP2 family protein [Labrenzia sp. CE80]|uniref:phosphatase PAP2 family protein n=1 Tax=Labrenzia sp. CE80 TaxID=1788986 RepID=UPI001AD8ADE3|nr:phosphatase PAP2 family protein [Labrenzia sp. CE80]